MYSNGEGLGTPIGKSPVGNSLQEKACEKRDDRNIHVTGKKRFIRCICPRCGKITNVYMMWAGRGIPRKYCADCKAIISGYDEAATCESHQTVLALGRARKRRITDE